jgi:hypothetical protein
MEAGRGGGKTLRPLFTGHMWGDILSVRNQRKKIYDLFEYPS